MIRRDTQQSDGSPAWVLISQIEHARLAGELARPWRRPLGTSLPYDDVILPTVIHHDDGWDRWEAQPTIDPASGRPRAFTEMPNGVAHDIWRRSIDMVSAYGPLAQYMVAQHFMRLRRSGDETQQPDVQAFLREYDARCKTWLAKWIDEDERANTPDVAELAVDLLQWFDRLSLILCCTPNAQPYNIETHGGPIELAIEGGIVTVQPWPWTTPELTIRAVGCAISAQPFSDDAQLRDELGRADSIELTWQLIPKSQGIQQ